MGYKKCYSGAGAVLTGIGFLTGFIAYILFLTERTNILTEPVSSTTYSISKIRVYDWNTGFSKCYKSQVVCPLMVLLALCSHLFIIGMSLENRV